jgi:hypothetical protein
MDENQVIENVEGEVVDAAGEPIQEEDIVKPKKFASVRFYLKDTVVYRFDLWTTSDGHGPIMDNGNKLIQLRNIINNFNAIRPENEKDVKDFFAIVGLIRFIFPKTMFPMDANEKEETMIVTLENQVSENIRMAKLKGFRVEINPESE